MPWFSLFRGVYGVLLGVRFDLSHSSTPLRYWSTFRFIRFAHVECALSTGLGLAQYTYNNRVMVLLQVLPSCSIGAFSPSQTNGFRKHQNRP